MARASLADARAFFCRRRAPVWYKDPGRKVEILLKGAEGPLRTGLEREALWRSVFTG